MVDVRRLHDWTLSTEHWRTADELIRSVRLLIQANAALLLKELFKFVSDDVHWDNPYDRFSFRKWYHIRWLPAWFQKAHAWTTIILILFWWMMGQLTNTEERFHSEPVLRIVSRENRWKNRAVGTAIRHTTYILIIEYFQPVRRL